MAIITGAQVRIRSCPLGSPALGATNAVLADSAMDDADPTIVTVGITQPAVARNLTVTGNDANCSGDVIIAGKDVEGVAIAETFALNGNVTVVGNKAFAAVTSITLPPYDTANTERVRVGTGAKLGLPVRLRRNTIVAAFHNGAREAVAPTIAFSAAAIESNTATLNTALNGSAVIVDLYETP